MDDSERSESAQDTAGGAAGGPEPVVDIPADAMSRFAAAEAQLYPMAMTDVATFQRATTLVGVAAEELRATCPDIATVLHRRAQLIGVLPQLAAAATVRLDDLPAEDIVDAASALRCRELQAAGASRSRQVRIEAARVGGFDWPAGEAEPADEPGAP